MQIIFESDNVYHVTCMVALGALFQSNAGGDWPDGIWMVSDKTLPSAIDEVLCLARELLPLVEDSGGGFIEWLSCLHATRQAYVAIYDTLDSIKHKQGDTIFIESLERSAGTARAMGWQPREEAQP